MAEPGSLQVAIGITQSQPDTPAASPKDIAKDIMAALKIRARVFTEGIMIMVCPVLLAITRDGVKSKIDESKFLRFATPPIAGAALEVGIVQFLIICLLSTVNNWRCGASKILIHGCVVLLMALASLVMSLIIGVKSLPGYVLAMVIVGVFTIYLCYMSWRDNGMTQAEFEGLKGSLDLSAEFSAAVTAVLFLGIEALALEGLMSDDSHELQRLLAFPLGWSFGTCGIGVITMLLVSVHPLISCSARMISCLQILSVGLAICVCVVVYFITAAAVGLVYELILLAVACLPFMAWFHYVVVGPVEQELKPLEPASLELTKITFAAFLAVTVATTDETPTGKCTVVFLCLSATAIVTGLQWRLVTHWKKVPHAVARGANCANFISHLCMAVAVIPFTVLAAQAVKRVSEAPT